MEAITVTYTLPEADAALKLYDAAVRHAGMDVAEAAVVLSKKLRDAAKVAEQAKAAPNPDQG